MANKICTHCKTENSASANYCRKCGFLLPDGNAEVSSDKTLITKIKDLQNKVSEAETESKLMNNSWVNLTNEKSSLQQRVSSLQKDNGNLLSNLYSANQRANAAEQEVKNAKSKLSKSKFHKLTLHLIYIIIIIGVSIFGIIQCNNNLSLNSTNEDLYDFLENVGDITPFVVGDIDVWNEGERGDDFIFSSNTTYIIPEVEIFSFITDYDVDIYVKLYTPDGLSTGKTSPSGYSYKQKVDLDRYKSNYCRFKGWGGKDKGFYSPGEYLLEFYYKGKCIGSKSFTIY